ncbi:hypothetical protein JG687_00001751 [Phytophthora cactorum]|uniref:Uncharacterized protein n=1 Tax=Phytophthora cactorum TaxID=29920 RepID=A0A8T1V080_9STRA|nr:hypothetical protein PC120_g4797 [Phytophthora cactorum]KAG3096751.1 hypothetical protein PC121_g2406 [Phytophthora cactorum]KAG3198803.1 hypothetical protein PC128_g5733 [Phytophthora cactorum]KAG4063745.1 hypothetical protein PC123_g1440 [Phytophthora cactorum]KAG6971912.1 hypothetical protein JG687_00001751 [Phytophthora cactorum]
MLQDVKVTLGFRVAYVVDLWVANIGEDIDVLWGMDVIFSAGLRLCVREGIVRLPDEEYISLDRAGGMRKLTGWGQVVTPHETLYLTPRRARSYPAKSSPVAVKVVSISSPYLPIDSHTPVAQVIEHQSFPTAGRFVRPGSRRYQEWQHLILENTNSARMRLRLQRLEQALQANDPPCVEKPTCPWPTKLMTRASPRTAEARMLRRLEQLRVRKCMPIGDIAEAAPEDDTSGERTTSGVVSSPTSDDDDDDDNDVLLSGGGSEEKFFDAISQDDDSDPDVPDETSEDEVGKDAVAQAFASTPV